MMGEKSDIFFNLNFSGWGSTASCPANLQHTLLEVDLNIITIIINIITITTSIIISAIMNSTSMNISVFKSTP